jgi:hypothetical protein
MCWKQMAKEAEIAALVAMNNISIKKIKRVPIQ